MIFRSPIFYRVQLEQANSRFKETVLNFSFSHGDPDCPRDTTSESPSLTDSCQGENHSVEEIRDVGLREELDKVVCAEACCVHCVAGETQHAECGLGVAKESGHAFASSDDLFTCVNSIFLRDCVFTEDDAVDFYSPDVVCQPVTQSVTACRNLVIPSSSLKFHHRSCQVWDRCMFSRDRDCR